jgi:hypothetical protein
MTLTELRLFQSIRVGWPAGWRFNPYAGLR